MIDEFYELIFLIPLICVAWYCMSIGLRSNAKVFRIVKLLDETYQVEFKFLFIWHFTYKACKSVEEGVNQIKLYNRIHLKNKPLENLNIFYYEVVGERKIKISKIHTEERKKSLKTIKNNLEVIDKMIIGYSQFKCGRPIYPIKELVPKNVDNDLFVIYSDDTVERLDGFEIRLLKEKSLESLMGDLDLPLWTEKYATSQIMAAMQMQGSSQPSPLLCPGGRN